MNNESNNPIRLITSGYNVKIRCWVYCEDIINLLENMLEDNKLDRIEKRHLML